MDRLARQGMRFTDMHSPSAVCTPTRYGLLTGRYCWRSALKEEVLYNYELPLIEPERPTVASLLREHGYHTACIGKWHLGLGWGVREGERFSLLDHALPWPSPPPPADEEAKIDFSRPITGGPLELGFDRFFGTSGCATAQPPYGFIDGDRMVGNPSVRKSRYRAGRARRFDGAGLAAQGCGPDFHAPGSAVYRGARRRTGHAVLPVPGRLGAARTVHRERGARFRARQKPGRPARRHGVAVRLDGGRGDGRARAA